MAWEGAQMTHGNSSKQFCSRLARLIVVAALGVVVGSGEAWGIPIPGLGHAIPTAPPNPNRGPGALTKISGRSSDSIIPMATPASPADPNPQTQVGGGTVRSAAFGAPQTAIEIGFNQANAEAAKDFLGPVINAIIPQQTMAMVLSDPGAAAGAFAGYNIGMTHRLIDGQNLPPNFQGTNAFYQETQSECIAKEQKNNNLTPVDAQNKCLKKPIEIGTDHPSANPDNPNPNSLGTDGPNTLRFTTMAFLSNKEVSKLNGDDMPFEKEKGADSESLADSFRLTSEAFCSIFGDVVITLKSDDQTKVVNSQMQRIGPWTCRQRAPKTDSNKFFNRTQLLNLCKDPVSLDVHRYCRAMYYYDLIKWTMQAQCVAFNNAAVSPRAHLPMLPRSEQECGSGSLLTGESTCPGPWGVTREDWDRTQEDLSLPGYTFTRGTAEAFFWAYGRETPTILGGGINIFEAITSIIKDPLGGLSQGTTLLCGDLGPTGRAEFTKVAKNWKGRHPVWVKAAMRFANARALLWTRDLTMQAWGVIQGFTSTIGMKDLSDQAKQLLTNAYDKDDEATVQKQLEWTAEILKKLELEADLARKSGTGVVGNAR
jgi:hypothetical protein